jgi:hypothetical protein
MSWFVGRYDAWHLLLTLTPVLVGAVAALLVARRPQYLGRMVLVYAAICIGIALSPFWLGSLGAIADDAGRRILVETKFAFIVGLAILLAAGGRDAVERA